MPAIEFGTQVWGYSCADLRDLQSFYLAAVTPSGRGKSRSISLLLWDTTSWRPATAPIATYAKILWQAMVSPAIAAVPLATLAKWYKAAAMRPTPRNWGEVCGPYDAMRLSLNRIGWKLVSLAVLQDHHETEHNVASIGPRMLEGLLKAAWRDRLAKQAAGHVHAIADRDTDERFPGRAIKPLDLHHAHSLTSQQSAG